MKERHFKWAVYGYIDDMLSCPKELIGRYRWKWLARLHCAFFKWKHDWGHAWVRQEECYVTVDGEGRKEKYRPWHPN